MAPKLDRSEGLLEVDQPAQHAYNRFRGVTPSPGAYLETNFGRLKITKSRMGDRSGVAGTFLGADQIAFAEGSLRLLEVQPEGRGRMSLDAVVNGWRLRPGDALVSS